MLLHGKNITANADKLTETNVFELYQKISNPSEKLKSLTNTLRTLKTIDEKKYRQLKIQLPYFCTSVFVPPFRKSENFAATQYFILDFDNIAEAGLNIDELKNIFAKNKHINLMFVSPSNNGLKLLFKLNNKCFDKGKYSLFYKIFAKNFADKHNLMQILDTRTSDVARACFLSTDTQAFYNAEPETVNISDYIDFDNPEQLKFADELSSEIDNITKKIIKENSEQNLPDDTILQIKQKLNPNIKTKKDKQIYVPEKLDEIISEIEVKSSELGLKIAEITNINYGKKIKFSAGNFWAEINVFFGQKGFTVVKTPKKGSSSELADTAQLLLCEMLYPENKR